jgi:putative RNA 2'-phosphotransferase
MSKRRVRISKFLSYILRHAPERFNLSLDEYGFAPVDDVLKVLQTRYHSVSREDLLEIVRTDPKGRYEIAGDRIRAQYGHSIPIAVKSAEVVPPEHLFHGTAERNVAAILQEGLKPMRRRFVHLSTSSDEAMKVGRRHSANVVILRILTRKARQSGVRFFREGSIYLAERIPPDCIELDDSSDPDLFYGC